MSITRAAVWLSACIFSHGAWAAETRASGSGALALAALVGLQDAALSAPTRATLARLLDGRREAAAASPPITVTVDAVVCRAGDVDISDHGCDITFRSGQRKLAGRAAHELYATLLENGVATDGAAGTIYAGIKSLSCRVDPKTIGAGGGADCRFTPDR